MARYALCEENDPHPAGECEEAAAELATEFVPLHRIQRHRESARELGDPWS